MKPNGGYGHAVPAERLQLLRDEIARATIVQSLCSLCVNTLAREEFFSIGQMGRSALYGGVYIIFAVRQARSVINPLCAARATASVRLVAPSLLMIELTWNLAVLSLITR
jgi:hypothetical protein